MHHEDGGLDVHDVVLLRVVEQPVIEEGELGVAGSHLVGAGREEPTYDGPPEGILRYYQSGGFDYNTWG